jgi:uncharacterized protein (DUF983 family)
VAEDWHPPVSPLRAGLGARCPRCGRGRLFAGFLKVVPACSQCGLALGRHDTGDGPAALIILVLGFVVVGLVFWVELSYSPPLWVHAVLWIPFVVGGTALMLRVAKATFIALQFKHRREDFEAPG